MRALLPQAQGSGKDALDLSVMQDQFSGGWAGQAALGLGGTLEPPPFIRVLKHLCLPACLACSAAMRTDSLGRFASSGPTHLEFPLY